MEQSPVGLQITFLGLGLGLGLGLIQTQIPNKQKPEVGSAG